MVSCFVVSFPSFRLLIPFLLNKNLPVKCLFVSLYHYHVHHESISDIITSLIKTKCLNIPTKSDGKDFLSYIGKSDTEMVLNITNILHDVLLNIDICF